MDPSEISPVPTPGPTLLQEVPDLSKTTGWLKLLWQGGPEMAGNVVAGVLAGIAFCLWLGHQGDPKTQFMPEIPAIVFAAGSACTMAVVLRHAIRSRKKMAALSKRALQIIEDGRAQEKTMQPFRSWLDSKAEDESLSPAGISVDNLRISPFQHYTRVTLTIHNNTGGPIRIVGLNLGWKKTADPDETELSYAAIQPSESNEIVHMVEISRDFVMENCLGISWFPIDSWISFGFTRHRIEWKRWNGKIPNRIS